jgi:DNA-binding SARP family transcriptional activator
MRFRILGPLEVWTDGEWLPITAEKWRSLLACLLLRANQVVSTEVLVDELWGDGPPARAKNLISIYVLRLRRLLGDNDGRLLAYRSPGYVLNLAEGDLDAARFGSLVADGRRALDDGDPVRAAALLSTGLDLWRGPFLASVPPTPLISSHSERAEEHRLAATELWAQAALARDRHDEVITELRGLVGQYPLREGLWLLLMRALDGAGRRAEALETYGQARAAISDELGVDPGADLRRLHAELLAADADEASADDAGPGRPQRRGRVAAGPALSVRPAGSAGDADSPAEGGDAEPIPVGELPGTIAVGSYTEPAATSGPGAAEATAVPPVDPAAPRPTQLPADIGDFTGREVQVEHLCDMLTSGTAVASPGAFPIAFVAGAGGLGKTTLAIHAAHQIREHFPDGQLYVDLLGATSQPARPGDVLARFLRNLGVDGDKVPAGDEERAALYRTLLTGQRVLIVLDNARDTAQVRPLLPGSASCAVLVTTRNRTADLASTRFFDLDVLEDDEALALFTRILGDERAVAEPHATAQVLEACAGLPLAIRICAARLAARSHWRIATMANRLQDQRRRLDELKVGDLAVRASFQVSYDSLQPSGGPPAGGAHPARVFRLLGLWQGPSISLPAAAALVGVPEQDGDGVEDALEGLVDAHLLDSPEPGWYRFHDLLRAYATERAMAVDSQADRDAAVRRLLRWYLVTADAAVSVTSPRRYQMPLDLAGSPLPLSFHSVDEALAWYDSERANVVAASRQAADAGFDDVAWQLATALFPVFNRWSNWADCATVHRVALASVRRAGSRQGEGWALHNLGLALARMRDKEGLQHLEDALAIRREISDTVGEAQATVSIADAYYQLEGPQIALKHMVECVEVARRTGRPERYAAALHNLGETYLELGRLDEAVACFVEVKEVAAEIGDAYTDGHATHNLGRAYRDMGRMDEAESTLREAIAVHRSTGDQTGEAVALQFLGLVEQGAGRIAEARASWLTALRIFAGLGDREKAAKVESLVASLPKSPSLAIRPGSCRQTWCYGIDCVLSITKIPCRKACAVLIANATKGTMSGRNEDGDQQS